jgi:hypothetical protein
LSTIVIIRALVYKKKSIKRTMDAKKHVLNGDPKFVKAYGSSSKSKG